MHQVLGRASSGNVRKVLFMLEELAVKYSREDYGPQFDNTSTDAYASSIRP
ncbi:MAG: glutathione S-transferase [Bradyrhizobium sp.]|jgi:glutathione S-transferase|nr:glutathione S-transferase [Bradyrhizobium sp.]